ncbi:hypothetical protein CC80DRAFT_508389 [Byssothecium circinans]|uniref:Uncharacterized protein n=1 Tax=Byssothecium circinans TaxID=147558 RepID=A0A6A5TGS0_9PLEO|nr:hypothetical protein CC80DRAFT_508389 [Byssothecium circinans]
MTPANFKYTPHNLTNLYPTVVSSASSVHKPLPNQPAFSPIRQAISVPLSKSSITNLYETIIETPDKTPTFISMAEIMSHKPQWSPSQLGLCNEPRGVYELSNLHLDEKSPSPPSRGAARSLAQELADVGEDAEGSDGDTIGETSTIFTEMDSGYESLQANSQNTARLANEKLNHSGMAFEYVPLSAIAPKAAKMTVRFNKVPNYEPYTPVHSRSLSETFFDSILPEAIQLPPAEDEEDLLQPGHLLNLDSVLDLTASHNPEEEALDDRLMEAARVRVTNDCRTQGERIKERIAASKTKQHRKQREQRATNAALSNMALNPLPRTQVDVTPSRWSRLPSHKDGGIRESIVQFPARGDDCVGTPIYQAGVAMLSPALLETPTLRKPNMLRKESELKRGFKLGGIIKPLNVGGKGTGKSIEKAITVIPERDEFVCPWNESEPVNNNQMEPINDDKNGLVNNDQVELVNNDQNEPEQTPSRPSMDSARKWRKHRRSTVTLMGGYGI